LSEGAEFLGQGISIDTKETHRGRCINISIPLFPIPARWCFVPKAPTIGFLTQMNWKNTIERVVLNLDALSSSKICKIVVLTRSRRVHFRSPSSCSDRINILVLVVYRDDKIYCQTDTTQDMSSECCSMCQPVNLKRKSIVLAAFVWGSFLHDL
jgi:hypothetical protein